MNEDLNCLGVLMTCVKRIPAHESYLKFISKHLRKAKVPLFKQTIRSSNSIATGVVYMLVQLCLLLTQDSLEKIM